MFLKRFIYGSSNNSDQRNTRRTDRNITYASSGYGRSKLEEAAELVWRRGSLWCAEGAATTAARGSADKWTARRSWKPIPRTDSDEVPFQLRDRRQGGAHPPRRNLRSSKPFIPGRQKGRSTIVLSIPYPVEADDIRYAIIGIGMTCRCVEQQ